MWNTTSHDGREIRVTVVRRTECELFRRLPQTIQVTVISQKQLPVVNDGARVRSVVVVLEFVSGWLIDCQSIIALCVAPRALHMRAVLARCFALFVLIGSCLVLHLI